MLPSEFEYLIRKTIAYLEFHQDDSAQELRREWTKVLTEIRSIKQQQKKLKKNDSPLGQ